MVTDALADDAIDFDVLYPAGEPVPESPRHQIVRDDTAALLRVHFADTDDMWVASNCNLYYREGIPAAVFETDVMVVAGVAKAELRNVASYRTWQHGGSVRFVLEIAEYDTLRGARDHERDLCADLGVAEYWRVDPTGGELRTPVLEGEQLTDGHWTPIDLTIDGETWRGHSASLDLDISWHDHELRFHLPGGTQPLNNLSRAETGRHAEREGRLAEQKARHAAETAHRAEREARRAEQEARRTAETALRAEQESRREAEEALAARDAEVARLNELLRSRGEPGGTRSQ